MVYLYPNILKIFIIFLAISGNFASTGRGKCECGVFFKKESSQYSLLFSHNPINVTCDYEGRDKCMRMCINLAQIHSDRSPEFHCPDIAHKEVLQPLMFARTCSKDWVCTNMPTKKYMCCEDGTSIPCKN